MRWIIGTIGTIIFLIAFTNEIGYMGNALTDPENAAIWLVIFGIVIVVSGIVEYI